MFVDCCDSYVEDEASLGYSSSCPEPTVLCRWSSRQDCCYQNGITFQSLQTKKDIGDLFVVWILCQQNERISTFCLICRDLLPLMWTRFHSVQFYLVEFCFIDVIVSCQLWRNFLILVNDPKTLVPTSARIFVICMQVDVLTGNGISVSCRLRTANAQVDTGINRQSFHPLVCRHLARGEWSCKS